MSVLRTPEKVAEDLGEMVSPHMVRRLIREGKVEYTKLSRGQFAMTDAQVEAMLKFLSQTPRAEVKRPKDSVFKAARGAH